MRKIAGLRGLASDEVDDPASAASMLASSAAADACVLGRLLGGCRVPQLRSRLSIMAAPPVRRPLGCYWPCLRPAAHGGGQCSGASSLCLPRSVTARVGCACLPIAEWLAAGLQQQIWMFTEFSDGLA